MTSYPPSFYEPFKEAFEERNRDIELSIIQRNSSSATRFILGEPDTGADVFWASATDAFELLKSKGALQIIRRRGAGRADTVLGYPLDDPDGYYVGFALSAYGLIYNPAYLTQINIPAPRTWQDLLDPVYAGHIGIAAPSRSGTTHLIVEALLQTYGWDQGWAILSEIGGNLSTVTARSFGVASGVAQRRFGIGITIDFLARTPDVHDDEVRFVSTPTPLFVPANVGILTGTRNRQNAERFVDFLFSREGQKILLEPAIGRIPVLDDLNRGLLPRNETEGLLGAKGFNARLSAERYGVVNLIFDDYIVRRRATLSRLWARLRTLEGDQGVFVSYRSDLATARQLLSTPPLAAGQLQNLTEELKGVWPRRISLSVAQRALARDIRGAVEMNLAQAESLLSSVSSSPARR